MKWLVDNWSLLVVLVCAIVLCIRWYKKFVELPTEEQLNKVSKFLLVCVLKAEQEFGAKTGELKLSWVYSEFVKAFPSLVPIISFEVFSGLVDTVLEKAKNMLKDNEKIKEYVEGK